MRTTSMDAGDLRIFEAVARLGGMNRAAAELNTVQSNVTARIRLLETQLGTRLFHRTSRGVKLTEPGQRLLSYAVKIAHLLKEARLAVEDDGQPKGVLTIGSLETTVALRLSPILADYARAFPEVELGLRTGTTCELVEDVLAHRVEGAFVCGPVAHEDMTSDMFFSEELAILTAKSVRDLDALIAKGNVRSVVLRRGCSYREILETMLAKRGVFGLRHLEFGTLEAIYGSVAAGLGITLLPKTLIGSIWRDGRVAVHEMPPDEARVDTIFVRRRDAFMSSALKAFLKAARPAQVRSEAAE
jgi:LysR family transcriptional regulator, cell division regulator